jgi:hypothetical protein
LCTRAALKQAALALLAQAHSDLEAATRAEWLLHHHTPYREVPYPAYSARPVRSLQVEPRPESARYPVAPRPAALIHAVMSTLFSR